MLTLFLYILNERKNMVSTVTGYYDTIICVCVCVCVEWGIMKSSNKLFYKNADIKKDFPGGTVLKYLPVSTGDTGSSPGREDPTCLRAAKPVRHNY